MLATWELEDDEANEAGSPPAQAGETGGARVQAPRAVGWVKSVFPVTVCGRQMLRLVGGAGGVARGHVDSGAVRAGPGGLGRN